LEAERNPVSCRAQAVLMSLEADSLLASWVVESVLTSLEADSAWELVLELALVSALASSELV